MTTKRLSNAELDELEKQDRGGGRFDEKFVGELTARVNEIADVSHDVLGEYLTDSEKRHEYYITETVEYARAAMYEAARRLRADAYQIRQLRRSLALQLITWKRWMDDEGSRPQIMTQFAVERGVTDPEVIKLAIKGSECILDKCHRCSVYGPVKANAEDFLKERFSPFYCVWGCDVYPDQERDERRFKEAQAESERKGPQPLTGDEVAQKDEPCEP